MSTYDIEELRQAMAEGAEEAPDTLGVLAAARRSAVKLRRRRRTVQAAGVTAALVAIAAVSPAALDALDGGTAQSGAAADRPADSGFGAQLTLRSNDNAYAMLVVAGTTKQHMEIRSKAAGDPKFNGTAVLYAAGAFDPSKVRGGAPVTVQGKPGYHLEDGSAVYPPQPDPELPAIAPQPTGPVKGAPLIAWEEAPGRWITVSSFSTATAAELLPLAELVEVETPKLPAMPFYLGYVPNGLAVQGVLTHNGVRVSLGLGTASHPLPGDWGDNGTPGWNEELLVDVMAVTPGTAGEHRARLAAAGFGAPTKLGPYDSWYSEASDRPGKPGSASDNGATLTVMTPECNVTFEVEDKNRIPRAELEKIALATEFKDCNTTTTWVRPVP